MSRARLADKSRVVTVLLPLELITRVDAYSARLKAASPDVYQSRSDVLRALVVQALARVEAEAEAATAPAKTKPRRAKAA